MQEVTFTLQTITPMFLAGADQEEVEIPTYAQKLGEATFAWKLRAELRPPSFRGLMRYWLRATVGGLVGTDPVGLEKVAKHEQAVFGTTDEGSTVRIRITDISDDPQEFRKESRTKEDISGKDYLLWSMARSGKGNNYKPNRWYFPPGTSFIVRLSARGQDNVQAHKLAQAIASFWLLTHLGGIGSRSHRCAGSLAVNTIAGDTANVDNFFKIDTLNLKKLFEPCDSISTLKKQLEYGIKTARSLYNDLDQRPIKEALFDILAPEICSIWILQANTIRWTDHNVALRDIGESLQRYRNQFDETKARKLLGEDIPRDSYGFHKLKALEIFGLPLGKNQDRKASPLLLRITKLQREFVCVAVLFKTTGEGIPTQNYPIIEDWINTFLVKEKVQL